MATGDNKPTIVHKPQPSAPTKSEGNPAIVKAKLTMMNDFIEYDPSTMEWGIFKEKIDNYFISNEIDDEKRTAAFLLTKLSEHVYKLIKDLSHPKSLSELKYEEICKILDDFYGKPVSVYLERMEFYDLRQKDGQSMNEWYSLIKAKSSTCTFGANLTDILRDKFITGLKPGSIRDRLAEEDETLTMEKALGIAIKKEVIMKSSTSEIKKLNLCDKSKKFNKSNNRKFNRSCKTEVNSSDQSSSKFACYRCGKSNHNASNCFYKNYKCDFCKEVGHLKIKCKKVNNSNMNYMEPEHHESETTEICNCVYSLEVMSSISSENHQIVEEVESADKAVIDINEKVNTVIELNNMYVSDVANPIKVTISIGEKPFSMEIDTGAGVSVIPADTYNQHLSCYQLLPTPLLFKGYTGQMIRPLGKIQCEVVYEGAKKEMDFHIVEGGKSLLLARDFLKHFNIGLTDLNYFPEKTGNVKLDILLKKYNHIFSEIPGKLNNEKVNLIVKDNIYPIFLKPRTIPLALKIEVEKELIRLENNGIITKVETSNWGTPIVPALKKDGSVRLCGDYKVTLNKYLEVDRHPIPKISEIFSSLRGGEKFSKIDLKEAYSQIELEESAKDMCAWSTTKGIYRMNRMPYGIVPATAKFQRIMEKLFQGMEHVTVFVDDITVTGKNNDEHLKNLELVFKKLNDAGLTVKLAKCEFFKEELYVLGHIISSTGIKKSRDKVQAIEEAEPPTTVQQVQSFAGMVKYYAMYVPKLSQIMSPIYNLTKKGVEFEWTQECQKAFDEIKSIVASDVILVHYNPKLELILDVDASDCGIAACISHRYDDGNERPIHFGSRTLDAAEKNYSIVDKEALACVFGVKKFSDYLYGRKFILRTDHKCLTTLFGENKGIPIMAARRVHRWAIYLAAFDYTIEHIKGKSNYIADMLSRFPLKNIAPTPEEDGSSSYLNQLVLCDEVMTVETIQEATSNDEILCKVMEYIKDGFPHKIDDKFIPYKNKKDELYVQEGVIMWGYRVIIPESIRNKILKELHISHLGIVKTKSMARSYVYWPKIDKDIEYMINSCSACGSVRPDPPQAEIINWPTPKKVWERLHIDFAGPFHGKYYFALVDAYSKWLEIFPMYQITSTATIQKLVELFSRFGLPQLIVSDNGTSLVSSEFESFLEKNGIEHITSPPGHPQSNGLAENAVKSFKAAMMKITHLDNVSIESATARYLLHYRNVEHSTTGVSPAALFMGRRLRTCFDALRPASLPTQQVESKYKVKKKTVEDVKQKRNIEFVSGDKVLVRDYRKVNKKSWIAATVEKRIGQQTYFVKTEEGRIWKRHLNQMLKFNHQTMSSNPEPSPSNIKYYKKTNSCSNSQIITPISNDVVIEPTNQSSPRIVRAVDPTTISDTSGMVLRPRTNLRTPSTNE